MRPRIRWICWIVYENATVPVKIIHLTRDARGNIFSMVKRLKPGDPREAPVTQGIA